MNKAHDSSYKLLFSEPEIIIDLLQGFVHEPWIKELDFSTLEKVSGSYISDDLRSREDDVIWRVKYQQSWIYVYLLIEFQSTIDNYMAVRLMSYMGLLYQDLIKTKQLTAKKLLPPIFPVVLYNGEKRWDAATELKDLIVKVPGGLEKYLPSLNYLLLDEGAFELKELTPLKNLVAAIFRLENSTSREDIIEVISNLIEWLSTPEQTRLRRSFTIWIKRVLLPAEGLEQSIPNINDLAEIKTMLAQRVSEWTSEWKQQGWIEGMEKGMEKGIESEKILLVRLIQRRFGYATSETAKIILKPIMNTDTLEQIGDWIIDCNDGETLLSKLKAL
jgi:predicted transposase/invertase (TIGR01784 family)